MELTDGIPSPEIFRLWTGISIISGALERRVWVETARSAIYPNLFILFVAPPAVGKSQAIEYASELWRGTKKLLLAPDNVTTASMVDALFKASRRIITEQQQVVEYHSMLVCCSELGVLMPGHDLAFMSTLNYIYDNPRVYHETRRTRDRDVEIIHPQLNIIAGTQPGFMANILPEEAWSMGFTSRLIMIYSSVCPYADLFERQEPRAELRSSLLERLVGFTQILGHFQWTVEAKAELVRWHREGCDPVPGHSKLQHYNKRRILYTIKLSMTAAIARSGALVITLEDLNRARDWLIAAEQVMPDIFREMVQHSDAQVIQELHYFAFQIFQKERKAVHESRLIHFLQNRVPSEKVMRILELCDKSNVLCREAGSAHYTPKPKHEHGLE